MQSHQRSKRLHLLAPAKINLYLRVGPLGADGYAGFHPLVSWMVTVGLFDSLVMERTEQSGSQSLRFSCDVASLPTDERNLVVRAARLLTGSSNVSIELRKQIPHAAGLGGGSSDAATTLLGLNQLLELNRSQRELSQLSEALGSDVPFFFSAPSAVCTGRGEIVHAIPPPKPRWAVLMFPNLGLSTARVYQVFDARRPFGKAGENAADLWKQEPDWQHWASLKSDALLPVLVNDLEPPAFELCPQLATLHQGAQGLLNRIVRMSGSGSTLFTLFDEEQEARAAALAVAKSLNLGAVAVCVAPDDDKVKR
jgi:4-diphosphocytidyl-2-C-methyl-D-erythritol kinase